MQASNHDQSSPFTVAVLGTGIIGSAMARNLQRTGMRVRVWNRTRARAAALASEGIAVCETPAEAVRAADVVLTVLKDGDSVQGAIDAAIPGLAAGTLWLQMGTVGVEAAGACAALARRLGLAHVDAPVMGTKAPAELGQLLVLAAGAQDERAQRVFDAVGRKTVWLSEEPGVASRLKLVLNSWVLTLNHGVAETLALAEALGVAAHTVAEVLRGSVLDTPFFHAKAAAIAAADFSPSFTVENAIKDSQLILSAAHGRKLDLAEAGLRRLERAREGGHGAADMAASFLASQTLR